MGQEKRANTAIRIVYRPFAMVCSIAGGLIAAQIVRQIWMRVTPHHRRQAPTALESKYKEGTVLAAAAIHGAVFGVVKAAIDRAGARAFQRWTGEWPGK
jgi:hypothetical protein